MDEPSESTNGVLTNLRLTTAVAVIVFGGGVVASLVLLLASSSASYVAICLFVLNAGRALARAPR
eukprot:268301-Prorocentrum_minimum.AAC.1